MGKLGHERYSVGALCRTHLHEHVLGEGRSGPSVPPALERDDVALPVGLDYGHSHSLSLELLRYEGPESWDGRSKVLRGDSLVSSGLGPSSAGCEARFVPRFPIVTAAVACRCLCRCYRLGRAPFLLFVRRTIGRELRAITNSIALANL